MIEVEQFTLRNGVEWDEFRLLDAALQSWVYTHRPRLLRRTTAFGDNGAVLVVSLHGGTVVPEPPDSHGPDAAPLAAFDHAVDPASYRRSIWQDLD